MTDVVKEMFDNYKETVGHVIVEKNGSEFSGTAFHIGNGFFVTAKHVLKDAVCRFIPYKHSFAGSLSIDIVAESNDGVDLAIFKVDKFEGKIIEIGGHLDDWVGDELQMTRGVVLGYPPIPMSHPVLVSDEVRIIVIVDKYIGYPLHFICSALPRGGYSGGPLISEYGFLLGTMTESLLEKGQQNELGYFASISIEPLLEMLVENKINCGLNYEFACELIDGNESIRD